jgi:sorbitol/mannitol transport system permease protein
MKHLALLLRTVLAWGVTLLVVFPLIWLVLTAFKTEQQAIAIPPQLFFTPTLDSFAEVNSRSDYLLHAGNSVVTSLLSTVLGLLIAAPAAYSMAFFRTKRTRDVLMWMLSTKMMPAVGALVPVYVLAQTAGLLDSLTALTIVFTMSNLPIMVRPLAMGTLASTSLLCLVLSWNESFWALNLSSAKAGTLAALIASYSSPEGLFWAKLSAASLMAIAPIVVVGWFSQKQLVQGLTFGAVK